MRKHTQEEKVRRYMLSHNRMVTALLLAVLSLMGCYREDSVEAFLDGSEGPISPLQYQVYPPDAIEITSLTVPEVNGVTQVVSPDGKLNLPLVGSIYVAGKTVSEIEESISRQAERFYEDAAVRVNVVGYNSQRFYVIGQVRMAGPVPWTGRDSLLEVLARAQPTLEAWPERIRVIRPVGRQVGGYVPRTNSKLYMATGVEDADTEVKPKVMTVNYLAMVRHGDLSKNILLQPNDIIYVEANPFAKAAMATDQFFSPVRAD
ncbi:MAG: polysaccharide biosynthesis/export family protein, partial [Phycisphaerae bacterium]